VPGPGDAPNQPPRAEVAARRRAAALAGHRGDAGAARELLDDPSGLVRSTALGALERLGALTGAMVARALADPDPLVRRRACEAGARFPGDEPPSLAAALDDPDPGLVEVAAWACGEREPPEPGVVTALSGLATAHDDPLVREAAVAALGAIGHPEGLPAILAATADRATVRRRAVIALAPFEGPEVEAALARARDDRDWQVRQAAEDLA
jgi:HEAT repeat protein